MFAGDLDEIDFACQDVLPSTIHLEWFRYIAEDLPNENCLEVNWLFA